MTALAPLLTLIASKESGKEGYNAIYAPAIKIVGRPTLTTMSLDKIRALQERMVPSRSTALGRYQFIRNTFDATRKAMGLPGSTLWSEDVQDAMAIYLLRQRGLDDFLTGKMSRETFANNLAKEWASLPVVTAIKGAKRQLQPGQSYYSGDGLNKAFHKPEEVLACIDALKRAPPDVEQSTTVPGPYVPPEPPKPPYKPSIQVVMLVIGGAVAAFGAWLGLR